MADQLPAQHQLPPQTLQQINDGLQKIKDALIAVDYATRAGFDVSQQKAALENGQQRLLQIKNTYYPGQP